MMRRNFPQTIMSPNSSNSSSPALSFHKDSQTISKTKPKIRIIHIFAPEIIKTDAANFRELVQRLTGKPSQEKGICKRKARIAARRSDRIQENGFLEKPVAAAMAKKMELRTGFFAERVKEEELGLWNNNIGENSGGFLSTTGFGDFDGFIQELGEFPFLPLDASHMHGFEEAQLA